MVGWLGVLISFFGNGAIALPVSNERLANFCSIPSVIYPCWGPLDYKIGSSSVTAFLWLAHQRLRSKHIRQSECSSFTTWSGFDSIKGDRSRPAHQFLERHHPLRNTPRYSPVPSGKPVRPLPITHTVASLRARHQDSVPAWVLLLQNGTGSPGWKWMGLLQMLTGFPVSIAIDIAPGRYSYHIASGRCQFRWRFIAPGRYIDRCRYIDIDIEIVSTFAKMAIYRIEIVSKWKSLIAATLKG